MAACDEDTAFAEKCNVMVQQKRSERDRLATTYQHVKCNPPWKREFVLRNGQCEFCDVLEMEVTCEEYPTLGDYIIAQTSQGRIFFAFKSMGHFMEGDEFELAASMALAPYYKRKYEGLRFLQPGETP